MNFEIKNRFTAEIIFSIETESLKSAVRAAIESGANLSGADLRGADLRGADLDFSCWPLCVGFFRIRV